MKWKEFYNRNRNWAEPVGISVMLLFIAVIIILPLFLKQGSTYRFLWPLSLLALLFVPVVIYAGVKKQFKGGRMLHPLVSRLAGKKRGWRTYLPSFSTGIRALVVALIAISLARPQDAGSRVDMEVEGMDIMIAFDVSGSMAAPDMRPNRFIVAKEVVLDFISRRRNDRMGAVVFARDAYTLCPLTLDYSVLSNMLAQLELGVVEEQGTAIGNALGLSINRLRASDSKSKVIVLLTDGANNYGNISPEQAMEFARILGIKIYTVLIGTNEDRASVNPDLLIEMAEKTGGEFFDANDVRSLKNSFHRILDSLDKSKIEDQGFAYAEVFPRFLFPAMILALFDLLISLFVMRRTP